MYTNFTLECIYYCVVSNHFLKVIYPLVFFLRYSIDLQDDLGGDTVGGDGVNRATSRRPADLLNDRGNTSAQVGDL